MSSEEESFREVELEQRNANADESARVEDDVDEDSADSYRTYKDILSKPFTKGKARALLRELLSGLTVSLAQVPEAVAFSFTAGVDPLIGLQAAWMVGLITALFGGAPGMVSGATGALAVVLPAFVEEFGVGYLFVTVLMMGVLQFVFGVLGGGMLIKLVGHPVMLGFCNGLAIVIGIAQFHSFQITRYCDGPCDQVEFSQCAAESNSTFTVSCHEWTEGGVAGFQALEVVATMAIVFGLPKLTRAIPSSLAGIVAGMIIEFAIVRQVGFQTPTVGDLASVQGQFPIPVWLDSRYRDLVPSLADAETYRICLPIAATMAIIGLVESLMTLQLVAQITDRKPSPRAEAMAQGAANVVTGIFGGMGGCAMIGQSMINVKSGGVTRISTSFSGAFLLVIILVAYPLINLIPMASLAGVMFMVVIGTFEWHSIPIVLSSLLPQSLRENPRLRWARKIKRWDALIVVLVTVVAVVANLAYAVGAGVVLGAIVFAWDQQAMLEVVPIKPEPFETEDDEGPDEVKVYQVRGPLFFASAQSFVAMFRPFEDPDKVIVYLDKTVLADYSAMVAINAVARRYQILGKEFLVRKVDAKSMKAIRKAKHLVYTYDPKRSDELNKQDLLSMELEPSWEGADVPMHVNYHPDKPREAGDGDSTGSSSEGGAQAAVSRV